MKGSRLKLWLEFTNSTHSLNSMSKKNPENNNKKLLTNKNPLKKRIK